MSVPFFHILVCSYAGASKMSCNPAGKREASGFSALSSPALATSFSKTLPPSLITGHKLNLCGVCPSVQLLWTSVITQFSFFTYEVLFTICEQFLKRKAKKAPPKTPNPKQMQTPNPWVWWEGCTTQIWELDFSLDYADTVTSHLLRAWGLD